MIKSTTNHGSITSQTAVVAAFGVGRYPLLLRAHASKAARSSSSRSLVVFLQRFALILTRTHQAYTIGRIGFSAKPAVRILRYGSITLKSAVRISLLKLFGNSGMVPNRGSESGQEGSEESRFGRLLSQERRAGTPAAIFQTVSEGGFYEVDRPTGYSCARSDLVVDPH